MGAILPLLIAILGPMIFKGLSGGSTDSSGRQTRTVTTPASGYQSPLVGLLDPLMTQMLGQNMKRGANWGWPAGQGIDTSWIDQMLTLLGGEWPKLLEGYKSGNMGESQTPKTLADLTTECKTKYPGINPINVVQRQKCIQALKSRLLA